MAYAVGATVLGRCVAPAPRPTANRVSVDQNTTNNIFGWTFGPELAVPAKR